MSGHAKIGGFWKDGVSLKVKVSSTWKTVNTAYIRVAGSWKIWWQEFIYDSFTKTTSGNLGVSDTDHTWVNQVSGWIANGSAASTSTSGALATIDFKENVDLYTDTPLATTSGLVFWGTSAGSFWAVYPRYRSTSVSYPCCPPNAPVSTCGPLAPGQTCPYSDFYTNCCGSISYGDIGNGQFGLICSATYVTCTTYTYYTDLRVWDQNTSSYVDVQLTPGGTSTVTSLGSIAVSTAGNQISIAGYTGSGKAGTAYTGTVTPSSPVKGTKVGLYSSDTSAKLADNFTGY